MKPLRIITSAFAGFAISFLLVIFPGTIIMKRSMLEGPLQEILGLNLELEVHLNDRHSLDKLQSLMYQAFWLSIAQNEVNCFPLLLAGSCVGPLFIWSKSRLKR